MATWREKVVVIPGFLRELHGERSTRGELALVYGGAALLAGAILRFGRLELAGFEWWKLLIVILVALDISGGALANLTPGTNRYWHDRRPAWRAAFVLLHAAHPLALYAVFPEYSAVLILSWVWAALATAAVGLFGKGSLRDPLAMLLTLLGACLLIFIWGAGFVVTFLMVEYQAKLVYGFAPDRRKGDLE